jgi:hypothetical protein
MSSTRVSFIIPYLNTCTMGFLRYNRAWEPEPTGRYGKIIDFIIKPGSS